jgi:hypothetical protein
MSMPRPIIGSLRARDAAGRESQNAQDAQGDV